MTENEDDDPVGPAVHDPVAQFTALAVEHGLIRDGDRLDQNMIDFATGVVSLCAAVADGYVNPSCPEDTVGDHIRAELFEH
jgi:hypothetical protein